LAFVKTDKILYSLEIMLALNVPLFILIAFQAYTHNFLTWNSVFEVLSHWRETPSFSSLTATVFTFSGFIHMVIFYRVFNEKVNTRRFWLIPLLGLFNLATTFLIPIGMHGANGVADYTFPWIATSDSLHIEYGPIERVVSVFLLLYIGISLTSVLIHWHVAYQLLMGIPKPNKLSKRKTSILSWIFLGSFGVITFVVEDNLGEEGIFKFGELWLNTHFPVEVLLVLLIWFLARREKA
jgi:spore germination protein KB